MSNYGELYIIVEDAKKELLEWARENRGEDPDDQISEIADSSTPVYNYNLMEIGMQNLDLACEVPDMETDGSAVSAMQIVILEHISQELHEYWREIEGELDEESEEEPDEDEEPTGE